MAPTLLFSGITLREGQEIFLAGQRELGIRHDRVPFDLDRRDCSAVDEVLAAGDCRRTVRWQKCDEFRDFVGRRDGPVPSASAVAIPIPRNAIRMRMSRIHARPASRHSCSGNESPNIGRPLFDWS
jgi:hypothetical protein